jgi:hypothetical protein
VAHAIRSTALPRQSAGPILAYHTPDISVSFDPFNTISSTFGVLGLAQWRHSAALRSAFGQINIIVSVLSKDNVAHAI